MGKQCCRTLLFPRFITLDVTLKTCGGHTARASMGILREMFTDRIISRHGNVPWPAKSPDLTVCDVFFGATSKVKCTQPAPTVWLS
ncbi:hypothetical protein C0J52_00814 [Blattella germanica]|nr:hypothetical protein C0J52_00814 [Blattella germanica]